MAIANVGSRKNANQRTIISALITFFQFLAICLSLAVVGYSNLSILRSASKAAQPDTVAIRGAAIDTISSADAYASPQIPPPKIPHNIIFTYKHDILQTKEPKLFYDNVVNTRDAYISAWGNDPAAQVYFLDDDGCRKHIEQAEPKLLHHFDNEKQGMYKADICRIAALTVLGGYYFDTDLKVVEPLLLEDGITFATVKEAIKDASCIGGCPKDPAILAAINAQVIKAHEGNMFQAFLAAEPGHPILRAALHFMLLHYEGKKDSPGLMGVSTLADAYQSISPEERGKNRLLQEYKNTDKNHAEYYDGYHQADGKGCCCDYLVHDPVERKVYFFSRIVGSSEEKCALQ